MPCFAYDLASDGKFSFLEGNISSYRPLVRRNSKRQRTEAFDRESYSDNDSGSFDSLCALVSRRPTEMEDLRIRATPREDRSNRYTLHESDRHFYSRTTIRSLRRTILRPANEDSEDREREMRLRVNASIQLPTYNTSRDILLAAPSAWCADSSDFRKDWVYRYQRSESRDRRVHFSDKVPSSNETTLRTRRIKRTRTEEWRV